MPRGLPQDVRATFHQHADGLVAKYTTCWLAVSDASPDNSCLNFLPKKHDPGISQDYPVSPYSDSDSSLQYSTPVFV
jgi:hypothetical protein